MNEFIPADREYLTRVAGDLRRSAGEVVRGMSVAVVYGPVSAEDYPPIISATKRVC